MMRRHRAPRAVPVEAAVDACAHAGWPAPSASQARRDERGSVTAELAVALPAVVLMIVFGVGALTAATAQVRLQDAAADAARLVARGDAAERATRTVVAAVSGAGTEISHDDDLVCVEATAPARVAGLVTITLTARSCALAGGL